MPANYHQIFTSMVANSAEPLTPERIASIAKIAEELASLDIAPPAPPPPPVVKSDPTVEARKKLAELNASPLPPYATDRQKIERAAEHAKAIAVLRPDLVEGSDETVTYLPLSFGGNRGDAA